MTTYSQTFLPTIGSHLIQLDTCEVIKESGVFTVTTNDRYLLRCGALVTGGNSTTFLPPGFCGYIVLHCDVRPDFIRLDVFPTELPEDGIDWDDLEDYEDGAVVLKGKALDDDMTLVPSPWSGKGKNWYVAQPYVTSLRSEIHDDFNGTYLQVLADLSVPEGHMGYLIPRGNYHASVKAIYATQVFENESTVEPLDVVPHEDLDIPVGEERYVSLVLFRVS